MEPLKFLTTQETADMLGMSRETIRRWCEEGRLLSIRPGKDYRIPHSEVDRMLMPVVEKGGGAETKVTSDASEE